MIIYIPIEITQREYASKILLTLECLSRGAQVVIGHKGLVERTALKSKKAGVYFNKSSFGGGNEKFIQRIRKKGFFIVAQDEEAGIIYEDFSKFYSQRQSLKNINMLDIFFTWGKDDFDFLSKIFNTQKENVVNSGGLRAMLWGRTGLKFYQKEIQEIKNQYQNFILITSNLATYNSYLGKEEAYRFAAQYKSFQKQEYLKQYDKEKKIFKDFVQITHKLSIDKKKRVIIRPHPGEGIEKWKKEFTGNDNVIIKKSGDLLPWIAASKFIIQNSSTAAIESAVVETPVVVLCFNSYDNVPNQLAVKFKNIDELLGNIDNIESLWSDEQEKIKRKKILDRKLIYYGNKKPAEIILDSIIANYKYTKKENEFYSSSRRFLLFINTMKKFRSISSKKNSTIIDQNKRDKIVLDKIKQDLLLLISIYSYKIRFQILEIEESTFLISSLNNS